MTHVRHLLRRSAPRVGASIALAAALAASGAAQQDLPEKSVAAPIIVGQKYFMIADGSNAFVGPAGAGQAGPLAALVVESGVLGHQAVGFESIDGSQPMQHWSLGDGDESRSPARAALRAGGVNVLAMTAGDVVPELGIDLFGDLMVETNMQGRILVQAPWQTTDASGATQGGYMDRLRAQLEGVNQRAGHRMSYVVPAGDAVARLRDEVARGRVPGLAPGADAVRASRNLVTYVWFAVMYRQTPSGLRALVDRSDPMSLARERVLQRIAWEAVLDEPLSGIMDTPAMAAHHH